MSSITPRKQDAFRTRGQKTALTVAEYAAHRGVRPRAVQRALKQRRIQRGADGLIDPAAADRAWHANTRANRRIGAASAAAPEAEAVLELEAARRRRLLADAARHELEVARLRGEVVSRALAVRAAHGFARALRTACQSWPIKIGPSLAAAFELDVQAVTLYLEDAVRDLLTELAGERVDF